MRFAKSARGLLLAACICLPTAAFAVFEITVDPDRLNGSNFFFVDDNQGINDTLTFDVNGTDITARGQVQANSGADVVTISWQMDWPNSSSANNTSASVSQDQQVRITLNVDFNTGPDYLGQAAPMSCKASAKIRDNGGPQDSPDQGQASVTCDLKSNWTALDDDDVPGTPGDPPQAALDAITNAFNGRKDVSADVRSGKLTIKFKGGAPV